MLARRAVLTLVTPPAAAIELATVKRRLHITHNDDDDELAGIIAACVSCLDGPTGSLGRCLITQTWDERFERFPPGRSPLTLALAPVADVASVSFYPADGSALQAMSLADLDIASDGEQAILTPLNAAGWPAIDRRRPFPVVVRYSAGYGDAPDKIPAPISEALMLHIGTLYERRDALAAGAATVIPLGYDDLLTGYRRPAF